MKITKEEYAELIRLSERVEQIKRYIANNQYISTAGIKEILDIEDETEVKNE